MRFSWLICRAVRGIQCLMLVVFVSVIHTTWSLPSHDLVMNNSSDINKNASPDKLHAMMRQRRSYQNEHDQRLHVVCSPGAGFYEVSSVHHNHYEDRRWDWRCEGLVYGSHSCYWSRDVNNYDEAINFRCSHDHFLSGVDSYHHNHYEDRRWSFYCCDGGDHGSLTNCFDTNYLNNWDADLHYRTSPDYVIVGVHSYHDNHYE